MLKIHLLILGIPTCIFAKVYYHLIDGVVKALLEKDSEGVQGGDKY